MSRAELTVWIESFPTRVPFTIARGSKSTADVIHVALTVDSLTGHGECVPYARYGETLAGTVETIEDLGTDLNNGLTREDLQTILPAGSARNAIDCALWDLEAKQRNVSVAELTGLALPATVTTAFTISLDTPKAMADAAFRAAHYPLLKLKLGGDGDPERMQAVRNACPTARLIVDANEAWRAENLRDYMTLCRDLGVELIEQPLPANGDAALTQVTHDVPICADESVHDRKGLAALSGRYDAVNIKLDKTGGLTEAIALARAAEDAGFAIMVGCMLGTSLAMAPALLLAGFARWIDLDGPLLLAQDRPDGLHYQNSLLRPETVGLWGSGA